MQAKDLLDKVILQVLAKYQGEWSFWYGNLRNIRTEAGYMDVPDKVWLAKMRSLIRRGLSGGCDCGCRGDYEITDKGLALIGEIRTKVYNGY